MVEWITDRNEGGFFLFAESSSAQKWNKQLPSHCLPSREGSSALCWGTLSRCLESWASLHRGHIWPTFEPSQTETLTSAKYSQLLHYTANPKIRLEKKKRKQKKMKKKIMLIVQKLKGCFSVPQRRCGPVGEGCWGMPGVNLGFSAVIHGELSLLDDQRGYNTKRRQGSVRWCSTSEKRQFLTSWQQAEVLKNRKG